MSKRIIFIILTILTSVFLFLEVTELHATQQWNESLLASELDKIIPPEIKNDAFYKAIYELSLKEPIHTILEIGSSSGQGSTQAFVSGMSKNPFRPTLFCMEVSKTRFAALKKYYEYQPSVICYNVSSIPIEMFPKKEEVILFYKTIKTNLNNYPLNKVLAWLDRDIDYIQANNVYQNGIIQIKKENQIEYFDMVLIDGSEFTGNAEFALVYGAKFILLDDIKTFKNYKNHRTLLLDPNYELLKIDLNLRNGFSIFGLKNRK